MGITVIPFAVSIDAVRSKIGSHDRAFVERLKQSVLYDNYASQCEDCDFDEIIDDLITGRSQPVPIEEPSGFWAKLLGKKPIGPKNHEFAHQYGYALIGFADVLGTQLPESRFEVFRSGKDWDEANKRLKAQGLTITLSRMMEGRELFPIPPIVDWPAIDYYSRGEIDYLLQHLDQMDIEEVGVSLAQNLEEEVNDLLFYFRDSLRQCQALGVELLSFAH